MKKIISFLLIFILLFQNISYANNDRAYEDRSNKVPIIDDGSSYLYYYNSSYKKILDFHNTVGDPNINGYWEDLKNEFLFNYVIYAQNHVRGSNVFGKISSFSFLDRKLLKNLVSPLRSIFKGIYNLKLKLSTQINGKTYNYVINYGDNTIQFDGFIYFSLGENTESFLTFDEMFASNNRIVFDIETNDFGDPKSPFKFKSQLEFNSIPGSIQNYNIMVNGMPMPASLNSYDYYAEFSPLYHEDQKDKEEHYMYVPVIKNIYGTYDKFVLPKGMDVKIDTKNGIKEFNTLYKGEPDIYNGSEESLFFKLFSPDKKIFFKIEKPTRENMSDYVKSTYAPVDNNERANLNLSSEIKNYLSEAIKTVKSENYKFEGQPIAIHENFYYGTPDSKNNKLKIVYIPFSYKDFSSLSDEDFNDLDGFLGKYWQLRREMESLVLKNRSLEETKNSLQSSLDRIRSEKLALETKILNVIRDSNAALRTPNNINNNTTRITQLEDIVNVINEFREIKSNLENEKNSLRSNLDSAESRIRDYEAIVNKINPIINNLITQNSSVDITTLNNNLELKIKEINKIINEKNSQLSTLEAKISSLIRSINQIKAQTDLNGNEFGEVNSLEEISTEVSEVNKRIKNLLDNIEVKESEIERLKEDSRNKTSDFNQQISSLNEEIETLRNSKAELESYKNNITSIMSSFGVDESNLASYIDGLKDEKEQLKADKRSLQDSLDSVTNERDLLNQKLTNLLNEINTINGSNITDVNQISELIRNLKSNNSQNITNLEERLREATSQNQAKDLQIQNLNDQISSLNSKISNLENILESNGIDKNNPLAGIQALKSKEEKLNSIIEKLKLLGYDENEDINSILEDLKSKSDALERINNLLISEGFNGSEEDLVNQLLEERKSLFEKLKMPKKDWEKAMKRIGELLEKEKNLKDVDNVLGNPDNRIDKINDLKDKENQLNQSDQALGIQPNNNRIDRINDLKDKENILGEVQDIASTDKNNVIDRTTDLVNKEKLLNNIKGKADNIGFDSDDLIGALDSIKALKDELEKIKEKAKELGLNTSDIDALIEELKSKSDELDRIKGKVGDGDIQSIIDNLLIDKEKLKQMEDAAKLLNMNNSNFQETIDKLNKEKDNLNERIKAETNAALEFRELYFNELEKNKDLQEKLDNKDKIISEKDIIIEKLRKENEMLKSKVVIPKSPPGEIPLSNGLAKQFDITRNVDNYQTSLKKADDFGMLKVLTGDLTETVTRNEVRELLEIAGKKLGLEEKRVTNASFKDVNINENANYLWKTGITNGIGNNNYGPNINLDRDMLAAFGLRFNGDFTTSYKDSKDKAISLGLISKNEGQVSRLEVIKTIIDWINGKEKGIEVIVASKSKIEDTTKKLE